MKPTLIIIDDLKSVRDKLRKHLENDFEIVGEAANGHEAVQVAAQTLPQLVLMDLVMPGMSGLEAMRAILASGQTPKIVIMSGLQNESVVMQALAEGAVDYLPKPLDPRVLTEVLLSFAKGEHEAA